MLPPRKPKREKRESRWRSPAHLAFVRSYQCCVEGCLGMPIEAAHVRMDSGAGMGQKPSDYLAVSLCRAHHADQHNIGEITFWDHVAKVDPGSLIAAFIKASPKRAEIERVMRERGNA